MTPPAAGNQPAGLGHKPYGYQEKLPHCRSDDEEEERRLFFVGLSRAKEYLYISHFGKPSVFWEDAVGAAKNEERGVV